MRVHRINDCNCRDCINTFAELTAGPDLTPDMAQIVPITGEPAMLKTAHFIDMFNEYPPDRRMILMKRLLNAFSYSSGMQTRMNNCTKFGCGTCEVIWCLYNECKCKFCIVRTHKEEQ